MDKLLYYLVTLLESALSVVGIRGTYEEPRYAVVERLDRGVEVRAYEGRVAVETDARGQQDGEAFGRLFRYITGANGGSQRIAMTTPVESEGRLIAMTVPVEQGSRGTMRFYLPRAVVEAGAPEPTEAGVRLARIPPERLAVLRFSGTASPAARDELALSRNFGKEIALAAGLDAAHGDAAVLIDADLQHPPEMIETFVEKWREGYDMVFGQRVDRRSESVVYRAFTRVFYRLFREFGETGLPPGAGDFRLMNRRVIDALTRMGERARFSKGLYAWVGFRSVGVPFDVAQRTHGATKWSLRKLFRFAFDGITSFSTLPLKVSTYVGLVVSLFAIGYAALTTVRTLIYGVDVPGFPSLIVSVMFFAGIQLVSLGVIGEYVGRIFAEVKRRPLYLVSEEIGGAGRVVAASDMDPNRTSL